MYLFWNAGVNETLQCDTHPYTGLAAMGRGLTKSLSNRTRRWLPSSLETSTVSRMESVQKRSRDTWSTAMPSGLWRSRDTKRGSGSGSEPHLITPTRATTLQTPPTFGDDVADVSPTQTGPADSRPTDVAPVDHLVHAVVGHGDHHTVLREERDKSCRSSKDCLKESSV